MTKNKFAVKRGRGFGEKKPEYERAVENRREEKSNYGADERAEFENERSSYLAEKLEFHAQKALCEENLPVSFAKLLCGETEEETLENIALFKEEFMKAIEAALSEKLRGSTPKTATETNNFDPFLSGFGY